MPTIKTPMTARFCHGLSSFRLLPTFVLGGGRSHCWSIYGTIISNSSPSLLHRSVTVTVTLGRLSIPHQDTSIHRQAPRERSSDTSNTMHPSDVTALVILAIMWGGAFYGMGMIYTVMALTERWRGPKGENSIGFGSVLAAILLSAAWPVVLIILLMSGN